MVDGVDGQIQNDVTVAVENTMMRSLDDKVRLARAVLSFADDITAGRQAPKARRA